VRTQGQLKTNGFQECGIGYMDTLPITTNPLIDLVKAIEGCLYRSSPYYKAR
jgi:hypothetical protein